ncbi:MAG: flavin oxidoreductase [Bacteroidetes bacterium 24-39-8]|jgi:flavin reductase (DIM6/NTAB) family NADH-FMN oxidoreductase RutF|nr:MAG: flavin oxidoreductase [Sphingobacteriia bacterium 35-40-8]OYZ49297.1 MAG: flavin oxidoreductase [Bacteroidetes bacterium 24-39-8]OZA67589.1 MAG: flavin oxidoreductase [Sphingobacteriia bacterium 39-39-8]HQR93642.1 flavin reductase [Sediminibacterium sp.]HQS56050.1 flavin reductase [Sediminibacterium sp.]
MQLNQQDLTGLDKEFRRAFINSLAGFRQAVLVGSISAEGKTNLAIFNSLIHLGANPALFGLINRPDTVPRDTLQNIQSTGFYSLNYVSGADYQKAHQTSARYPTGVSEFEQVGFEEVFHDGFAAPFVAGAIVQIAMKFEERIDIQRNGTVMIVGSIQEVRIDHSLVEADGFVNLSAAGVLVSQGLDAYFTASPLGRLPYAKP